MLTYGKDRHQIDDPVHTKDNASVSPNVCIAYPDSLFPYSMMGKKYIAML